MTPATGYLAGGSAQAPFPRLHRRLHRRLMRAAWRQSLVEIVLFRVLQGLFGAALVAAVADRADEHQSEGAAGIRDGRSGASR